MTLLNNISDTSCKKNETKYIAQTTDDVDINLINYTYSLSSLPIVDRTFVLLSGRCRSGASRSGERLRRCGCKEILYLLPMGVLHVVLPGKDSFISNLAHATDKAWLRQLCATSQFKFSFTVVTVLFFPYRISETGSRARMHHCKRSIGYNFITTPLVIILMYFFSQCYHFFSLFFARTVLINNLYTFNS